MTSRSCSVDYVVPSVATLAVAISQVSAYTWLNHCFLISGRGLLSVQLFPASVFLTLCVHVRPLFTSCGKQVCSFEDAFNPYSSVPQHTDSPHLVHTDEAPGRKIGDGNWAQAEKARESEKGTRKEIKSKF